MWLQSPTQFIIFTDAVIQENIVVSFALDKYEYHDVSRSFFLNKGLLHFFQFWDNLKIAKPTSACLTETEYEQILFRTPP